jgi:hypothetical protein
VLVIQRTSSDLRLNPHVHAVFLNGVHHDDNGGVVKLHAPSGLETYEVAGVLDDAARRITRYLRRHGLFDDVDETDALARRTATRLAPSPSSLRTRRRASRLRRDRRGSDGRYHLSHTSGTSIGTSRIGRRGFTLHAATRAGAMDERGREALLKYVLRPPNAQERVVQGPDGLVRIALKALLRRDLRGGPRSALALDPPVCIGAASALSLGSVCGRARIGEQAPSAHLA